jgi:hypothetical protein
MVSLLIVVGVQFSARQKAADHSIYVDHPIYMQWAFTSSFFIDPCLADISALILCLILCGPDMKLFLIHGYLIPGPGNDTMTLVQQNRTKEQFNLTRSENERNHRSLCGTSGRGIVGFKIRGRLP